MDHRLDRVPDRQLPAAYLGFAHLCLLTAFLALAFDPAALAGFFYHPKMLAVVHLVTLGWITGSILGALHLILPMAMRTPLPVRRLDRWAFWLFVVGVLGMVSHFWIDDLGGMVWSTGPVLVALTRVGWRVTSALGRAPIPFEHRLPFFLAFANLLAAGLLGLLIGIDKTTEILPGFVLDHVAAHAHLAALGWATFMVMGSAYRLLPMVLPSAVPSGRSLVVASVTTEIGLVALSAALFGGSRLALPAAAVFVAGVGIFLSRLRWMLANPRPAPKQLRRPDLGVLHIASAFAYLLVAVGLGGAVLLMKDSDLRLGLLMAYGVTGLVGFLSQMVVGISVRLLPLFSWMREFSSAGFERVPLSPHLRVARPLHHLTLWTWTLGTPFLALGLTLGQLSTLRLGATLLSVAVAASLAQLIRLLTLDSWA